VYLELSFKREVRYLGEEDTPKTIVLPSAEISSKVIRLATSRLGATFFPFQFYLTVTNIYERRYKYLSNWIFLSEEEKGVRTASSYAAFAVVEGKSITLGDHVQFLRSTSASPFAAYAEGKAFSSPTTRVKVEYLKELVLESEKI